MSGSHDFTTRAVVINRAASGEGSARIFLYSESRGLVGAFAKSAREERSKLRAHLQLGSYGRYTLVSGRQEWRVTGAADTKNTHFELSEKPHAQRAPGRIFSLVRSLVHGEGENPELFRALFTFLEALPTMAERDVRLGEYLAALRILASLGYVPPPSRLPPLASSEYSPSALAAAAPHERTIITAINEALLASNLA